MEAARWPANYRYPPTGTTPPHRTQLSPKMTTSASHQRHTHRNRTCINIVRCPKFRADMGNTPMRGENHVLSQRKGNKKGFCCYGKKPNLTNVLQERAKLRVQGRMERQDPTSANDPLHLHPLPHSVGISFPYPAILLPSVYLRRDSNKDLTLADWCFAADTPGPRYVGIWVSDNDNLEKLRDTSSTSPACHSPLLKCWRCVFFLPFLAEWKLVIADWTEIGVRLLELVSTRRWETGRACNECIHRRCNSNRSSIRMPVQ